MTGSIANLTYTRHLWSWPKKKCRQWASLAFERGSLAFGWNRLPFSWKRFAFGWKRLAFGWVRLSFGWDGLASERGSLCFTSLNWDGLAFWGSLGFACLDGEWPWRGRRHGSWRSGGSLSFSRILRRVFNFHFKCINVGDDEDKNTHRRQDKDGGDEVDDKVCRHRILARRVVWAHLRGNVTIVLHCAQSEMQRAR